MRMFERLRGRNAPATPLQPDPFLPGVPLVESPFFDEHVEKLPPAYASIARDLNRQGYAVFDFPDECIVEKMDGIMREFPAKFGWGAWREGKAYSVRAQDAWKDDWRVREIAANPDVIDLLSALYGRRAFPFQTLNFPVGTQQDGHADYVHFNSIPDRFMCGVWLAFEDIDEDNGPLFYYPGSHRWPTYQNEHLGVSHRQLAHSHSEYDRYVRLWERMARKQGVKREIFRAKKGQALIWAANLVHGGSVQNDPSRTRWSQVTHYFFEGCAYTTPLANDVYQGRTLYRDIVDVATGEPVRNVVTGIEVDDALIEAARPAFTAKAEMQPADRPAPEALDSRFAGHPTLPPDFDPGNYLEANPDVAAAKVDPYQHYVLFGRAEGRPIHPRDALPAGFDAAFYLSANPDVAAAKMNPVRHFIEFGRAEGRPYKPS